jgi:hypothetical protein
MPLSSRLISGDREILAVLDEMDAHVVDRIEGVRTEFVVEMLDLAASPHRWTPEELQDRAKVILGLFYFTGILAEEHVRGGLSYDRYAGILADLIVHGVSTSIRNPQSEIRN